MTRLKPLKSRGSAGLTKDSAGDDDDQTRVSKKNVSRACARCQQKRRKVRSALIRKQSIFDETLFTNELDRLLHSA